MIEPCRRAEVLNIEQESLDRLYPGATARRQPEAARTAAARLGERQASVCPSIPSDFAPCARRFKRPAPVPLAEAVKLLKTFNTTKFNQTVEVSTHLGIDPRQSDENAVRGRSRLPHGIGKTVRVAVFAQGEKRREGFR